LACLRRGDSLLLMFLILTCELTTESSVTRIRRDDSCLLDVRNASDAVCAASCVNVLFNFRPAPCRRKQHAMTGSCFGLACVGLVRRWHKPSCAPTRSRVSGVMRLPVRVPARRVPHGQMYVWGCEGDVPPSVEILEAVV